MRSSDNSVRSLPALANLQSPSSKATPSSETGRFPSSPHPLAPHPLTPSPPISSSLTPSSPHTLTPSSLIPSLPHPHISLPLIPSLHHLLISLLEFRECLSLIIYTDTNIPLSLTWYMLIPLSPSSLTHSHLTHSHPHTHTHSEELLLFHQLFLRGLHYRIEKWPVVVLGKSTV